MLSSHHRAWSVFQQAILMALVACLWLACCPWAVVFREFCAKLWSFVWDSSLYVYTQWCITNDDTWHTFAFFFWWLYAALSLDSHSNPITMTLPSLFYFLPVLILSGCSTESFILLPSPRSGCLSALFFLLLALSSQNGWSLFRLDLTAVEKEILFSFFMIMDRSAISFAVSQHVMTIIMFTNYQWQYRCITIISHMSSGESCRGVHWNSLLLKSVLRELWQPNVNTR